MKKAQGLPITVIIIAALGILVLIVLAAIFGGQVGKLGKVLGECPGYCVVEKFPKVNNLDYTKGFTKRTEFTKCADFESELTGNYVAKNLPTTVELNKFTCNICCVSTG